MQGIRAICVDLDDTLWPVTPVIERAERRLYAWLAEHYPRISATTSVEDMRQTRTAVVGEHPERCHDLGFLRREVIARHARAAGYSTALVDAAFAVFQEARHEVHLYEDVRPALADLKRRYRLISLTNGNAQVERIGLDDLFEHSITAVEVGAAKPHPAMFAAVVAYAGLDPAEIAHVGDDPVVDVAGARAAGLFSVWMNREARPWPGTDTKPHAEVRDLHELAELLD